MAAPLTDPDFRFSLRQFAAFSEAKAAECGLTPQQHQALLAIRTAPAGTATIGYVAARPILKPHAVTGLPPAGSPRFSTALQQRFHQFHAPCLACSRMASMKARTAGIAARPES